MRDDASNESTANTDLGLSADGVPLREIFQPSYTPGEILKISVEEAARAVDPRLAAWAAEAAREVVARIPDADLESLNANSPGLRGFGWGPYIELSQIRVAHALSALARHAPAGARILDFGAYFGNFSLAARRAGYTVEAADAYAAYQGAFAPFVDLLSANDVPIQDISAGDEFDLAGLGANAYDAVLFMGAIEHIPHSPRDTLHAINRVLKPGGVLILDTPNLGYVYTRRRLALGESIFPAVQHQYITAIPFLGHHREYLAHEVRWMLDQAGHDVLETQMFSYSAFGMGEVSGEHLGYWRLMERYPQLREIIFMASRKSA